MEDQIASAGQNFIGEHGWLLLAGAAGIIFKETITSFAAAVSMSLFGGIKSDDVYIMGGRVCRIVRVGLNAQLRDHMKQEGTEKTLYKGLLKLGERLKLD